MILNTPRAGVTYMGKSGKLASKLISTLSFCIALALMLLGFRTYLSSQHLDFGVRLLKAMYQFDSPRDLISGQYEVKALLTPDEFERLCVDNETRAINSYYKFGYSSSRVNVLASSEGYALYTLLNDNIDASTLWVLEYTLTSDSRADAVKEYKVINFYDSEEMK